jgi:hypothetical protein
MKNELLKVVEIESEISIIEQSHQSEILSIHSNMNQLKVFQQDVFNMCRVQEGLETTRKPGITLANYQEAKVRWIHKKLGEYITSEEAPKSKGDQ